MAIKRSLTVLSLILVCTGAGQAQSNDGVARSTPAPIAPGAAVDPAKSFDASITSIETLWMGAAKAMPPDKYSFAPSAAIFAPGQKVEFSGVRTFAQIVTHTIQANYGLIGGATGVKPDIDLKSIASLTSKDDIVKALAATFGFAHKAVMNITAANAFESVRGPQTRASAIAAAIGHAEDEYGQAVEYLRMNSIVPPASETPMKKM